MNQRTARAVVRMLLAAWAVVVVSWLGFATLVALSILWPGNRVPHVLLGLWLCAIVAYLGDGRGRDRRVAGRDFGTDWGLPGVPRTLRVKVDGAPADHLVAVDSHLHLERS